MKIIIAKTCTLFSLLLVAFGLAAQVPDQMENLVRKVADHIITQTDYRLKDQKGKLYAGPSAASEKLVLKANSKYNKWMYVNGVLAIGMVRASEILADPKYARYAGHNYRFVFDNLNHFKRQFELGDQKVEWLPITFADV